MISKFLSECSESSGFKDLNIVGVERTVTRVWRIQDEKSVILVKCHVLSSGKMIQKPEVELIFTSFDKESQLSGCWTSQNVK